METQGLLASGSSLFVLPKSIAQCQQQLQDGRSVSIPSSSQERQWSFRVERRKLTLLSGRKKFSVDVRAKRAGGGRIGTSKGKSKESEAQEVDADAEPDAWNKTLFRLPGTQRFPPLMDKGKSKESEAEEADADAEPDAWSKTLFKLPGTQRLPSKGRNRFKDKNTVFVAGATGKVGRRAVRELVKLGYNVRAGVRNPDRAQFLLEEEEKEESVDEEAEEQPKKKGLFSDFSIEKLFGFLAPKGRREGRVELVQCDLESSVEDIEEALGNAGLVICTIGAGEKQVLDVTGPYRIDYKATKNLIDAASSANANHFILVTSLGTQKFGWPAAALNLFWGVLYWKAKAEEALVASGIPFTIVRPGGMERPTDAYKETHNLRLAEADTLFGGQVSNLQVAELMAAVVDNLDLARNKVLEVVAETTAPLRPFDELLAEISSIDEETEPVKGRSEISREEQEREAALKRQAAETERAESVRRKLQEEYEAARLKEEEARKEAEAARAQTAEIEKRTSELRSKLQAAEQVAQEAKARETALIEAARQGKKAKLQPEQKPKEAKQKALEAPKEISKVEATVMPPTKSKAEVAAEKKAKQEVERKAKEEAEAELAAKEEAEAKAKADAAEAEKKRIEAEQIAKEEEEEGQSDAKVETKGTSRGFRWPWQTDEPEEEAAPVASSTVEEVAETEQPQIPELPQPSIPLSPNAQLPTLEPPAPPSPPPAPEVEENIATKAETTVSEEPVLVNEVEEEAPEEPVVQKEEETSEPVVPKEEETSQVVAEASPENKTKGLFENFRWPWQQPGPEEETSQEEVTAADEAVVEETAPINQTILQEDDSTRNTELLRPSRPLSPYPAYPALKPPTPPSPPKTSKLGGGEVQPEAPVVAEVASSTPVESSNSASTAEPLKSRPLSPFNMYPGLKPPEPPSPPESVSTEKPKPDESTTVIVEGEMATSVV
ncbi:hypothetical protein R1flu_020890 [Riccia fluitans]|uniref:NAD(P)-binding domain-containing protein n=1 Tax=Riccia fluitans TaxID=41844 RepID=A0ABD1ZNZ9_9MARC